MKNSQVSSAIQKQVKQAREAFLVLANLENLHKNNVLHELAQALRNNSAKILAENARDMAEAQKMLVTLSED